MAGVPGINIQNMGNTVSAGIGIIYWLFIAMVIIGGIIVLIMFFMLQKRYNKVVEIRKVVNNTCMIINDKCREYVDDEGNRWWLRWGEKDKVMKYMSEPPASAINITQKGKMRAIAKLVDGHYFWLQDTNTISSIPNDLFRNIPQEIINETNIDRKLLKERKWKDDKLELWKRENNIEIAFHPLTSNQRAIYINALRRAEERRMICTTNL